MSKTFKPLQLIADYSYDVPFVEGKNAVRFLFAEAPIQHDKPYILIVIAQPVVSPINYPLETYERIAHFLDMLKVDIKQVDIYLDFEERYSQSKWRYGRTPLDLWKFTFKKGSIHDTFEQIFEEPPALKVLRDRYYGRNLNDQEN